MDQVLLPMTVFVAVISAFAAIMMGTREIFAPNEQKRPELKALSNTIDSTATEIEKALYQTQNKSPQDPLNFPIRLNNKLGHLNALSYGDFRPTDQAIEVKDYLFEQIDREIEAFNQLLKGKVGDFNERFNQEMKALWIKED